MFNLPVLTDLTQRKKLKLHKVSQLGEDLRLIARMGEE
jgi:hypothetical protein